MSVKLPNPSIRIVNHVGSIGTKNFPESSGIAAARVAYREGAAAMAAMFQAAIESGDPQKLFALAQATKTESFFNIK